MTSRRSMRPHARLLMFAALFLLSSAAPAQETEPAAEALPSTRIEIDEQSHVVRFIIDGEEMAVMDRAGMHVQGQIDYQGSATGLPTATPDKEPEQR